MRARPARSSDPADSCCCKAFRPRPDTRVGGSTSQLFGGTVRSMVRSKVAVLRVRPEHVLEDIDRLYALADVKAALKPGTQTILKDNISWHFPFPGANTTPWQLEGTVRSLHARGYSDLVCVQNKTV